MKKILSGLRGTEKKLEDLNKKFKKKMEKRPHGTFSMSRGTTHGKP